MANFENNLSGLLVYFQDGIRRSILIFCGIGFLFLIPLYFLAQGASNVWSSSELNKERLNLANILYPSLDLSVSEYIISRTQRIDLINGDTVFYTTINNRTNSEVGYFPFVYDVALLDVKDQVISQKTYSEYLLPGELKYIVVSSANGQAQNLKITPSESNSQPTKLDKTQNTLASKSRELEIRNPNVVSQEGQTELDVNFLVKNKSIIKIATVDLTYIVRDDRDRILGIGQYQIFNLRADEERQLSLKYPKPKVRKATRLDVKWEVNYLDKNNLILE